jgi:hypothetical protein
MLKSMAEPDMVTVFRSADESAEEDAMAIREMLEAEGIDVVVLDDSAPGVPEMAWEVRVAPKDAAQAEQLIADARLPEDDMVEVDASPDLATETVFSAPAGAGAHMEAMAIKSILDSEGIASIMVGDPVLPNLGFEIRVAKEWAERARQAIADAQAAGPEAAEQEEKKTETPLNP